MTGTTSLALAAITGALLALAAGCGGGGGSNAASTGSTTTSTTSTTTGTTGAAIDGTVGPGFTIDLMQNGQAVTTLAPGTYTLSVDDESDIHNFHLSGPGVDVMTDVSFTGAKSFRVTLQSGTYSYVCDPHASSMHGSFTVSG